MVQLNPQQRHCPGNRAPVWLAAFALLAACSSGTSSPESCEVAVALALDAGEYDAALERLGSRACETSMSIEEIEINRAAAYVGKAGYDIADLLLIVLEADSDRDTIDADLRLLQSLSGLGRAGGGLRFLNRANESYAQMVSTFTGRLDAACQAEHVDLLSPLQRDACFLSGLLAYARLARGFDLLLRNQIDALLGLRALDCANDANFSGVADEGEIVACALVARNRLDQGGGICNEADTREEQSTGVVRWERIRSAPSLDFFQGGVRFATVVPLRIVVEAGGDCATGQEEVRLLQPMTDGKAQLLITDGACETETERACPDADSAANCWPCPIPRGSSTGAVSVAETLLDSVNVEAERWLAVLADKDSQQVAEELEELRDDLCEPAEGGTAACEEIDEHTRVTIEALIEYLQE